MTSRRILTLALLAMIALAAGWLVLRSDGTQDRRARRAAEPPDAPPTPSGLAGSASESTGAEARGDEAEPPVPEMARRIQGIAVNANRGRLPGAEVHIVGNAPGTPPVLAAEDGTFSLPDRPQRTVVWIRAPGLVMAPEELGWVSRKETKEFRLVEGVPLHVVVVSATKGAPLVGATVRSFAGAVTAVATHGRPSDEAVTGADGRATVLVPAGAAFVVATTRGHAPGRTSIVDAVAAGVAVRVELPIGATVEGRVVTAAGAPVEGADLHFVMRDLYDGRTVTTKDGVFRFDGVPAGVSGGVSVRAKGWGPTAIAVAPLEPSSTQIVEFRLHAARALDVQCLARDGTPVHGVYVLVRPVSAAWDLVERETPAAASGRTDSDGHVRLEPVPIGPVLVEAERDWMRDPESQTIEVPADAPVAPVVIRQPPRVGPRFEVRVLDPEGKPLAGARVVTLLETGKPPWTPDFRSWGDEVETDALGVVALMKFHDLPMVLSVIADGFVRMNRRLDPSERDGPRIDVQFPKGEVTLRFEDPAGAPVSHSLDLEPIGNVLDSPWRRRSRTPGWADPYATDEAGRVTIRGLGDSTYVVESRSGGRLSGPLTLRASPADVVFTVTPTDEESRPARTPILLKHAATGEPVLNAQVVVVELDDDCYASPDTDGSHLPPEIPAGTYDLSIFAEGFLPARASRVALNGSADPVIVEVALERGASIAGTVRDDAGLPVPGVEVGVTGDEGASALTGDDGTFSLSGLVSGMRNVVVTSPRLMRAVERFLRVAPELTTQVDIGVSLAGALTVQLDGSPWGNDLRLALHDAAGAERDHASSQYLLGPGSGRFRGPVHAHTFESLPPGSYWLVVTWNGEPEPWIPLVVTLGQETTITIAPP